MIKAKELRIGNWMMGSEPFQIEPNDIQGEPRWKAIPLTEEWLLKFGFELDIEDDGCQKGKYKVSVSDEGCLFFIYIGYYHEEIAEFKYVHQLQNLYFALTGEELQIKQR